MQNESNTIENPPTERISWKSLLAFASPGLPNGIILFPAFGIIPTFYAKYAGLSLATIGTILILAKLVDAVSDPLVGYYTDVTRTRFGKRRPWMVLGAAISAPSAYFLFSPQQDATIVYFTVWFILLYVGLTVLDIPHRAWGMEMSRDYDERSRIATYLTGYGVIGMLIFATTPMLGLPQIGILPNTEFGAETLAFLGFLVAGFLVVTTLASVMFGPPASDIETGAPSFASLIQSLKSNKVFWFFLGVFALAGLGNGMHLALSFLYMDTYLQVGNEIFLLLILDSVVSFLALPVWLRISYKIGKHKAWAIGTFISALAFLFVWAVPPGKESLTFLFMVTAFRAFGISASYILPTALLGDVVDYDILKRGINRSGNFFAAMGLIAKINGAVGSGIGFMLLALFGYTVGGDNDTSAILALKIVVLGIPFILVTCSTFMILRWPLGRRQQETIRRRIESRAMRLRANRPATGQADA